MPPKMAIQWSGSKKLTWLGGPLLLAARNSRLALGRGIAAKIFVETIQQEG